MFRLKRLLKQEFKVAAFPVSDIAVQVELSVCRVYLLPPRLRYSLGVPVTREYFVGCSSRKCLHMKVASSVDRYVSSRFFPHDTGALMKQEMLFIGTGGDVSKRLSQGV